MIYTLDVKFKQYVTPLSRIIRERYGHQPDVRDAGNIVEFHFPTIVSFECYKVIKHFIDGFVTAIQYNE